MYFCVLCFVFSLFVANKAPLSIFNITRQHFQRYKLAYGADLHPSFYDLRHLLCVCLLQYADQIQMAKVCKSIDEEYASEHFPHAK